MSMAVKPKSLGSFGAAEGEQPPRVKRSKKEIAVSIIFYTRNIPPDIDTYIQYITDGNYGQ